MSKEFSGEQKLRIVLESIIRNVPKGEQSQKYGVTEEEFQSWHDHLIQNGGKIFDSSVRTSLDTRKPKRKMSPLVRIFLSISLLTNLGLIIFGIVYVINRENKKDEWVQDDTNSIDSPINLTDDYEVQNMSKTDIEPTKEKEIPIDVILENSREKPFPSSNTDDIGNLLASPNSLPVPSLLPPVSIAEPAKEVSFMGKSYEGRHVVYLLDVGTYVLDGNDSVGQFEKNKESFVHGEHLTHILSRNKYHHHSLKR